VSIFPAKFTAGLTFKISTEVACYPASDGWGLSAALRGPGVINIVATVDLGKHRFAVGADATVLWAPGRYDYTIRAAKAAEVFEVESGTIEILPDLSAAVIGHDGRTHAEKVLESIEAVIQQRATLDQERYRINNRELYRTPIADLLKLRDVYRAEVQREKTLARGGNEFRSVRVIL
jgi:hypothetical protein